MKSAESFIFWTNNADHFSIDKFSGFIIKRKAFDAANGGEFTVQVFARHSNDNAGTEISSEITIRIASCKTKSPIMISGNEFTVSIGKFLQSSRN